MCVKSIHCQSATDLLTTLTINGPTPDLGYRSLLYRGVAVGSGDNEHRLVPSSLRLEGLRELLRLSGSSDKYLMNDHEALEWQQARMEAKLLGAFFRYADTQGLPMPEITTDVRRTMQLPSTSDALFNLVVQQRSFWPPDILLPLAGQAQHYGLPTRLLDWSRDPWVALYFAAKGGMDRILNGEAEASSDAPCIAVWVLNLEFLDANQRLVRRDLPPHTCVNAPISLVTAPAATNANLRAQQGVFTVWRPKFSQGPDQPADRRPLDELLAEAYARYELTMPFFYKYTLPLSNVRDMWRILQGHAINNAKMFPDFSGAVEAVRENARYN